VSASKPAAPEPDEIAGRFQIVQKLGAGAFGTVYKARDKVLGRMVAIKTIRLEGLAASQASLQEMLDRFSREARVAAQLKHPNIVTIYDIGNAEGLSYISMEFIDGVGLDRVIAQTGRMSVERAAALGTQVADALDYAYRQQKLVHRDIKPANIMIEAGDRVKVTDFGIAKVTDSAEHLTMTGSLLGTPSYMSPEQARGHALDGRSDLFSLGCVLYEMVAGVKAFRGESITALLFKIITEEPPPIRDLEPTVPDELLRIVAKALSKDPETRYQTGRELADDLLALTKPGFVPTLRQADVATIPGSQGPGQAPTIATPPTSQVTVSSASTLGRPAGASATVPAATAPVGPTVLIPETKAPPPLVAPPPPPVPRKSTAGAPRPPQPLVGPAPRKTGMSAGALLGLALAGLVVVAVAGVGGWYLLGRRAAAPSPTASLSPAPETTSAPATPAPATGAAAGGPAAEAGTAGTGGTPSVATAPLTTLAPPPARETVTGARPGPTQRAQAAPPPAGRAGGGPAPSESQAGPGAPQAAPGETAPAAGNYDFLNQIPSEALDGRDAGAVAQKYRSDRSGGSTGYGATTRLRARERFPGNTTLLERPAVGTLWHLMVAENAYHKKTGRYGSLRELQGAGVLRLDVPILGDGSFRRARYHFTVSVQSDGFRAEAQPLALQGRPFFVDDSGYIRSADQE
jgi:serine/threonine-protein kinase